MQAEQPSAPTKRVLPPWWPVVEAAYARTDPTVFDANEVIDVSGMPEYGDEDFVPGETQITWNVLGFDPGEPFNSVLEFTDGTFPLLFVPLTPDNVTGLKRALDYVYASQLAAYGVDPDAYDEGDYDESEYLDEDDDGEKSRLEPWRVSRRVKVGGITATIKEPRNTNQMLFAGLMVGAFIIMALVGIFSR